MYSSENDRPYGKVFKTIVIPSGIGGTDITIKTGKKLESYPSISEARNAIGRERFWANSQIFVGGAINISLAYSGIFDLLKFNVLPWQTHNPLVDLGAYVVTFGITMYGAISIARNRLRREALQKYTKNHQL